MEKELEEALEQVKFFKENNFYDEIGQHYGFIDKRCNIIENALINKSKKEKGFDILLSILTDSLDFEEEREALIYSTTKVCEETFGKDSKELILIKELLNIDENKYINFCKEHSKNV